ncbi:MAG: acyltransferase, partial [Gemmatimonadaceae bacterium]|nr:acyltransferase [Gloeobacterales cyanobacterium ES-bin-141]
MIRPEIKSPQFGVASASNFEWIDFLRGLSILGVVLHHVRVDLWIGWSNLYATPARYSAFDLATAWLALPTPFLGSMVMLFFLVSGFCIHYPYANAGRKLAVPSYGLRRFLRIYPPYLAAIVLVVVLEHGAAQFTGQPPSSWSKVLASLLMVQNYGPEAGQMVSNPSLWSLPVEVEFYLLYPLFSLAIARAGIRQALLAVGIISVLATVPLLMGSTWTTGNFANFWIIWCGGVWLAERTRQGRLPRWGLLQFGSMLAAFAAAIAAYVIDAPVVLQNCLWSAGFFLLLLWGLTAHNPLGFLPASLKKSMLFLGTISYSLYLVHFPFFRFSGMLWVQAWGAKPSNFLIAIVFSAVAVGLGYLFYLCFEAPSHRFARILSSAKSLGLCA